MSSDIPFTWADAWLLESIIAAAGDCAASSKDVIAVGDTLNHTIFTFAQLDGALARPDFLCESQDAASPRGRAVFQSVRVAQSDRGGAPHPGLLPASGERGPEGAPRARNVRPDRRPAFTSPPAS
jgi:hypothetical protein